MTNVSRKPANKEKLRQSLSFQNILFLEILEIWSSFSRVISSSRLRWRNTTRSHVMACLMLFKASMNNRVKVIEMVYYSLLFFHIPFLYTASIYFPSPTASPPSLLYTLYSLVLSQSLFCFHSIIYCWMYFLVSCFAFHEDDEGVFFWPFQNCCRS